MFSWIFNFSADHWRWVLLMFSPTTSPRGWKAVFPGFVHFWMWKFPRISEVGTHFIETWHLCWFHRDQAGKWEATLQFLITWSWICRNLTWDFMRFYLFSRIHLHFTSFHPWFEAFFQELWVFDLVQSRMVHRKISYVSSWDLFFPRMLEGWTTRSHQVLKGCGSKLDFWIMNSKSPGW